MTREAYPDGGESELFAFRYRGNFTGLRPPASIGRSCIPILKKNLHVAVPESASTWYPAETDARLGDLIFGIYYVSLKTDTVATKCAMSSRSS